MTSGTELIKKINNANNTNKEEDVFLMTIPLLTNSKGVKFGKSEGNAIWLDQKYTP